MKPFLNYSPKQAAQANEFMCISARRRKEMNWGPTLKTRSKEAFVVGTSQGDEAED